MALVTGVPLQNGVNITKMFEILALLNFPFLPKCNLSLIYLISIERMAYSCHQIVSVDLPWIKHTTVIPFCDASHALRIHSPIDLS